MRPTRQAALLFSIAFLSLASRSTRLLAQGGSIDGVLGVWLPQAEKGDAHAEYMVGNAYFTGRGATRDFRQAADWLRKASVQGDPKAMVLLGLLCSGGKGVPLDTIEALKWYTLAAERSDPEGKQGASALAQILTPDQVREGRRRASQSDEELFPAKERRAKAGDARAQFEVGLAYARGFGIPQDLKQAFRWLSLAATKGLPEAQNSLAKIYEARGQTASKKDKAASKKEYAAAMHWFRLAARSLPEAEVNLGGMYYKGEGVPRDIEKALSANESAAVKGSAEAYHNLGSMYYNGIAVQKDPVEACKWFLLAASRGDSGAQRNVARCSDLLNSKQWEDAQARATIYLRSR